MNGGKEGCAEYNVGLPTPTPLSITGQEPPKLFKKHKAQVANHPAKRGLRHTGDRGASKQAGRRAGRRPE